MSEYTATYQRITIYDIKPDKEGFSYNVIVKNSFSQHTDYYFSKDLATITKHRDKLIQQYKDLHIDPDFVDGYAGHIIKPRFFARLRRTK